MCQNSYEVSVFQSTFSITLFQRNKICQENVLVGNGLTECQLWTLTKVTSQDLSRHRVKTVLISWGTTSYLEVLETIVNKAFKDHFKNEYNR